MKKENRYAVAFAVEIHVNHYHCYLLQNPNSLFTLYINKNYPLYNVIHIALLACVQELMPQKVVQIFNQNCFMILINALSQDFILSDR